LWITEIYVVVFKSSGLYLYLHVYICAATDNELLEIIIEFCVNELFISFSAAVLTTSVQGFVLDYFFFFYRNWNRKVHKKWKENVKWGWEDGITLK